jgi:hypothetical protein
LRSTRDNIFELGRDRRHLVYRKSLPSERFDTRYRLRLECVLAGHLARRHRALLDRENRLAVGAIKQIQHPALGDDRNRGNAADCHAAPRAASARIPYRNPKCRDARAWKCHTLDRLSHRVRRHYYRKIRAGTIAAVAIPGWRANRQEH